jgi:hypothetical protein
VHGGVKIVTSDFENGSPFPEKNRRDIGKLDDQRCLRVLWGGMVAPAAAI